jgi:hypothetical protein
MVEKNPYSDITLLKSQVKALKDWADEADRHNGCTAWGPKFDAVMQVARQVRIADKRRNSQ